MTIDILRQDMIAAMKAKDKETKDAISSLIAAVKKVAIDEGVRDDIPEAIVDKVILKELKSIKEQIDTCPDERTELKAEYMRNYEIAKKYAPEILSEDKIKEIIATKFPEVLATKNKGMIMKAVMAELSGRADGKVISQVVADLCK